MKKFEKKLKVSLSDTPRMDAIWAMYGDEGDDYSYELYQEGQKLERELVEARGELRRKNAQLDNTMWAAERYWQSD